jgi:hypothetical protein
MVGHEAFRASCPIVVPGGAGPIWPLSVLESYVFHVTLETLQELQIHMVPFEPLGDLNTACGSGSSLVSPPLTGALARPHITASLPTCYSS